MASAAEAIILSSSPAAPKDLPMPASLDLSKPFDLSPRSPTPPPFPTAAELFRPPSRSRFFADLNTVERNTKKKGQGEKSAAKPQSNEKNAPNKPQQKSKKVAKKPKPDALATLDAEALDSKDNTARNKTSQKQHARKTAKTKETGNMTLAGKVTKGNSDCRAKKSKKAADEPEITDQSSHSLASLEKEIPAGNKGLQLEEALRRRRDWTPPKETAPQDVISRENGNEAPETAKPSGGLGMLLSDYGYSGATLNPRNIPSITEGAPTKRRKIELVDPALQLILSDKSISKETPVASSEDSSSSGPPVKKKPKSQKKPTTVTGRMTAQYTSKDGVDDATLIKELMPEITKAKSSRSKVKTSNQDSSFNVASPEAAIKTLDAQDLIFGTCSQLEREDSPQGLQDMQEAIRASESVAFGSKDECSSFIEISEDPGKAPARLGSRLVGTKNLWGVGARDTDGTLVQAEKVKTRDSGHGPKQFQEAENALLGNDVFDDDEWLEHDHKQSVSDPQNKKPLPEINDKPIVDVRPSSCTISNSPDEGKTDAKTSQLSASGQPSMPQYTGFTSVELSKQVAAYGFKSVRGRKKMIELLQKCWESKHGKADVPPIEGHSSAEPVVSTTTAADSKSTNVKSMSKAKTKTKTSTVPAAAISPSRKLAPKLDKKSNPPPSSFIDVEEIQDSEEEITPSPSRVQKHYNKLQTNTTRSSTQGPFLDVLTKITPDSPTARTNTSSKVSRSVRAKSTSQRSDIPDLRAQITKAIRAQPQPSTVPPLKDHRRHPTWHEKIIMYDAVILEDLTSWLNVEGFTLIGEDREVGPLDVRKWCEDRGISCCWKQGSW